MNTPAGGLAWPHDTAASAVLESVAARLRADPDALVEAAMATVADDCDELRRDTRLLARQLADLVRHRRRLTPGELERIEALGAVRAAGGLALDDLQRASRTALAEAWRHLVGLVPTDPDSLPAVGAVARLAEEVLDFVQQSAEAVVRGHTAHHRLGALQQHGRGRHADAGAALLFDGAGELARSAVEIGLDLAASHGVVLFTPTDGADPHQAAVLGAMSDFADLVPTAAVATVRTTPTVHAVVAVAVPTPDTWATAMATADQVARHRDVVALAAGPTRGAGGVFGCYLDAAALLPVVRQVGPVAAARRPDDLGIYHFLASVTPDEARGFVQRVLGPLLDLPQPDRGDALRHLATVPADGDDDGLARIRLDTALALLRRYPDLDGPCTGTGQAMDERTPDETLEAPQPAPDDDLADEGGPTQSGAERSETPNPPH